MIIGPDCRGEEAPCGIQLGLGGYPKGHRSLPVWKGSVLTAASRRATTVAAAGGWRETTSVEPPDIRYAKSGDVNIAYAVVGDRKSVV